jgi:hypothetical protein
MTELLILMVLLALWPFIAPCLVKFVEDRLSEWQVPEAILSAFVIEVILLGAVIGRIGNVSRQ